MSDSPAENKILVRRIYEDMWNAHYPAAARGIFTHSVGVELAISEFLAAFPDLIHTVEEMIAEGDRVAARFTARGTHTGQWKSFTPTGKTITYTSVTLARIANGLIIEHTTWWDRHGLVEQLGG
jgi:predicted ester cyclase